MKTIALSALVLLGGVSLIGNATGASIQASTEPFPFVERVSTKDYLAAEKLFPEKLSLRSDLVFLRTSEREPATAVALAKRKDGSWRLIVREDGRPNPDGTVPRKELVFDAKVAAQVMKAVERTLHENVMLPPKPRPMEEREDSWWIFFRDPKNIGITAVIESWGGRHPARGSHEFMDGIVWNLWKFADAKPAEREGPLHALDEAASLIVFAPPPSK